MTTPTDTPAAEGATPQSMGNLVNEAKRHAIKLMSAEQVDAGLALSTLADVNSQLTRALDISADALERLRTELTAANAALAEARAETERYKSYYDLWYFVMDEAPLAFEEIVKTCSPASWMGAAQHLKKQRESK